MRLRKLDLVIVMLLAGAAFYVFLAETRYHLDLEKLAGITLDNMEYPIGECWAQGQMPVQVTDHEVINLGHIFYNPFVYDRPSLNLVKDPMGMPGYYHFTARPLLPEETSIIESFNNGDFTGFKWYMLILGATIAYVIVRCLTSIRKTVNRVPSAHGCS